MRSLLREPGGWESSGLVSESPDPPWLPRSHHCPLGELIASTVFSHLELFSQSRLSWEKNTGCHCCMMSPCKETIQFYWSIKWLHSHPSLLPDLRAEVKCKSKSVIYVILFRWMSFLHICDYYSAIFEFRTHFDWCLCVQIKSFSFSHQSWEWNFDLQIQIGI